MQRKLNVTRGDCGCASTAVECPPAEGALCPPDFAPAGGADRAAGVVIRPRDFAPLFGDDLGDVFLLVASPRVRRELCLDPGEHPEVAELAWTGPEARAAFLGLLAGLRRDGRRAAVLWIADDEYEHYYPEQIEGAKLGAISYFSGSFSPESLRKTIRVVTATDYHGQLRLEAEFVGLVESSRRILFHCPRYGTTAAFRHQEAEHWFSMHGPLDYGQQIVLPTGELATLTNASGGFDLDSRFPIDGEVVLRGEPIVHRGGRDVTAGQTEAMYEEFSCMRDHAVVLEVECGFIHAARSAGPGPNPLLAVVEKVFAQDRRYRKIHEVGFGTNPECAALAPFNFFPNERYPGVHFGLGLGGYTSFHHDLVCTEVEVLCELDSGETVNVFRKLGLRNGPA
jgi:hypothetical protein